MGGIARLAFLFSLVQAGITAAQPPAVTWTHQWDFNTGAPGWSFTGGRWVDPAVDPSGPMLPDGSPSGAGGGNLYLPDGTFATFNLSQLGYQSTDRFVMQANLYIPNLRPLGMCQRPPSCKLGHDGNNPDTNYGLCWCIDCTLGFHFCDYPGNMNDRAGLQMVGTNSLAIIGDIGVATQMLFDGANGAYTRGSNWLMEQYLDACHTAVYPYNDWPLNACWWDTWITVWYDCNYTIPGRIRAWVYVPWNGGRVSAGWQKQFTGTDGNGLVDAANGTRSFRQIRIGMPTGLNGESSWTQVQYDNIRIALGPDIPIPEVCNNHVDDNLDGLEDCDDPQCYSSPLCPCPHPWADQDRDGDVDMSDFGKFQACLRPTAGAADPNCDCFDRTGDGKIDHVDFAKFTDCLLGPDVPASPVCGQ